MASLLGFVGVEGFSGGLLTLPACTPDERAVFLAGLPDLGEHAKKLGVVAQPGCLDELLQLGRGELGKRSLRSLRGFVELVAADLLVSLCSIEPSLRLLGGSLRLVGRVRQIG